MDETVTHATEHPELRRAIGSWMLFFFVLGDIVGAGVYALVGEVGAVVGGAIWSAFLFAFILAVFTAGSYTELVAKYPRAGGAATYVNNAFGVPFLSFMVAFDVMAAGSPRPVPSPSPSAATTLANSSAPEPHRRGRLHDRARADQLLRHL